MTNAEWIRSMSDEELAAWLHNICAFVSSDNEEPYMIMSSLMRFAHVFIQTVSMMAKNQ